MSAFSEGAFSTLAFSANSFDISSSVSTVPLIVVTKSKSQIFLTPNFSPTPDCFVGFIGIISPQVGFNGLLNDSATGVIGELYPVARFEGIIDPSGIGIEGAIYPNAGFEGAVTGESGFNGDLCDC